MDSKASLLSVASVQLQIPPGIKVADLINRESNSWKTEYLRDKVDPVDLEVIHSIPIPCTDQQDNLIWHYTANGWFIVRSAYGVAMQIKRERLIDR